MHAEFLACMQVCTDGDTGRLNFRASVVISRDDLVKQALSQCIDVFDGTTYESPAAFPLCVSKAARKCIHYTHACMQAAQKKKECFYDVYCVQGRLTCIPSLFSCVLLLFHHLGSSVHDRHMCLRCNVAGQCCRCPAWHFLWAAPYTTEE